MELNSIMSKNSPADFRREKENESDFVKIVNRNIELMDELKEKEKEINRLKNLCDQYEEEHNTVFMKWQDDIQRMTKALHRMQLIQMDGEMSIKDITELTRILGGKNE